MTENKFQVPILIGVGFVLGTSRDGSCRRVLGRRDCCGVKGSVERGSWFLRVLHSLCAELFISY